jgi:hypothetical protein
MKGLMIYSSITVLHKLVAVEKRVLFIEFSFAGFPAEEWTTTVTWQILSKLNSSFRSVSNKYGTRQFRQLLNDVML